MDKIVGGIYYVPNQKQNVDIYGEPIDIPNVFSYQHLPQRIETPIENAYVQQYAGLLNFIQPTVEQSTVEQPVVHETPVPIQQTAVRPQVKQPVSYSSNESAWNAAWERYGSTLGIKDLKAYAYILGQVKHESGDFKYMEEIASGSAYEGRKDLGNTQKGDGKKYKGRGPIQVTGRANYEKIYKDFFIPNGLGEYDIVNNPELAKDPYVGSLLSIGWLAVTQNGKRAIAAANNYDIKSTTKAINGGYNGLNDRIRRTNDLLKALT